MNTISEKLYAKNVWEGFTPDKSKIDYQGWNGIHPCLATLNTSFSYQVIVDLGVWKGQSTITLSKILKDNNLKGSVIAVDTFLGSPEHHDMGLFKRMPGGRPDIYETFLNNIWENNLQDYVVPLPQTTVCASYILKNKNIKPTFVHVDAAHEYEEVLRDIEEYYELMEVGGIMVCDDYIEGWPGVVKAVNEFSSKNKIKVFTNFPKCIFQKT